MTAATFDLLAVAREFEAAGVERHQAEVHAEGLRRAVIADRGESITTADLEAAISGPEARLTSRLHAVILAAVAANGLITAALELLWPSRAGPRHPLVRSRSRGHTPAPRRVEVQG